MKTKIKELGQALLVKQKALYVIEAMKKTRRPPMALLREIQDIKRALKHLRQQKQKAGKKQYFSQ
jgi:hypothetical protein